MQINSKRPANIPNTKTHLIATALAIGRPTPVVTPTLNPVPDNADANSNMHSIAEYPSVFFPNMVIIVPPTIMIVT